MKKRLLAGSALAAAIAMAWAAKDPVIMTVNGVDIPLSEFEYLYHKNNLQQAVPQTVEEYAELFKLYKMKAAEGRALGLDTTADFRSEMEKYRLELAMPYMTDSTSIYALVDEEARFAAEEASATHIMLFKSGKGDNTRVHARLDSIRNEIVKNGASWDEMARTYSHDQASAKSGGNMGYISAMKYPYAFEKAVFETPEGEVSEIVETPNTMHIVKGGKHRPTRGKVLVSHILKLVPPGASPEVEAAVKRSADSLYNVVVANPESFGIVARDNSDDKSASRNMGRLPLFGAGEMVEEFDKAAFALADGEISKPVKSRFGWHIIQRIQGAPGASREEVKAFVLNRINNPQDPRYMQNIKNQTSQMMRRHSARIDDFPVQGMLDYAASNGLDSTFYAKFGTSPDSKKAIMYIGKTPLDCGYFVSRITHLNIPPSADAVNYLNDGLAYFFNRRMQEMEMERLAKEEPEYRNLINEYHDGSLLFAAQTKKVWDKGMNDTEGLKAYFDAHRDDYRWDKPHAKGYLVQAVDQAMADSLKQVLGTEATDERIQALRKEFRGKATIDRVCVAQGENKMVDYLMFDGEKVSPKNTKYTAMFMFSPSVAQQPEEVADVRGQVTTDYQNELERQWNDELKRKYKVKVNKKVLQKVK